MENTVETVDKHVEKSVESVKKAAESTLGKVFDGFHKGIVENFPQGFEYAGRDNNGYKNGV